MSEGHREFLVEMRMFFGYGDGYTAVGLRRGATHSQGCISVHVSDNL